MSLRRKNLLLKWLSYSIWLIVLTALQLCLFGKLPLFKATPFLAPAIVTAVSLFDASTGSVVFSLCTGVMNDALTASNGFYTVAFTVLSVVLIHLEEKAVSRSRISAMLLAAASTLAVQAIRALLFTFFSQGAGTAWALLLPELLYSAVLGIFIVLILSRVDSRFDRNARHRR
ncbi:MAG: hypothetical protein IKM51_05975 [Oscillospiraceae bacterium]|nr:hypothetical protein [Oscillospiraceae bacterium]